MGYHGRLVAGYGGTDPLECASLKDDIPQKKLICRHFEYTHKHIWWSGVSLCPLVQPRSPISCCKNGWDSFIFNNPQKFLSMLSQVVDLQQWLASFNNRPRILVFPPFMHFLISITPVL